MRILQNITRAARNLMFAFTLIVLASDAYCAMGVAALHSIQVTQHDDGVRLIFDMRGAQPLRMGSASKDGTSIEFHALRMILDLDSVRPKLPPEIAKLSVEKKGNSYIKIMYREVGLRAKYTISNGQGHEHYFIHLDLSPASGKIEGKVSGLRKQSRSEATRTDEREAKDSTEEDLSTRKGVMPAVSGENAQGPQLPTVLRAKDDAAGTPEEGKAEELYAIADRFFEMHQHDLAQYGSQIREHYNRALKTGPGLPGSALATYRSGLASFALGENRKAEEDFRKIVSEYRNPGLLGVSWVGLGKVQERKRSFMEAVQAYRAATSYPLEKSEAREALCGLASSLYNIGNFKEAIETANKCIEDDPSCHLKQPHILRVLGEAHFALQQYGRCWEYLFRYLNIDKDIPDRDIILAKIAEAMLCRNELQMAGNVYDLLEKHYPDSEGYIISRIRKAEFLERDTHQKDAALAIYEELVNKPIPPALMNIVLFKLATREEAQGNYEKSLSMIDLALHNKTDSSSYQEFYTLREKVVTSYLKNSYSERNYLQAIRLYQDNLALFQSKDSTEISLMIAESYAGLKLYPIAVSMYRELMAAPGKKNEEWTLRLAQHLLAMGDASAAIQTCQAIKSESLDARKAGVIGQAYYVQNKYKEATQHLLRYLQNEGNLTQDHAQYLISLAESLMQEGRYSDALSWLQRASEFQIQENENRIRIGLLKSKCLQNVKQPQKAAEVLEEMLSRSEADEMKDQINYELSMLYINLGQIEKGADRLTQLMNSSQDLWKAVAQQQLGYLQIEGFTSRNP